VVEVNPQNVAFIATVVTVIVQLLKNLVAYEPKGTDNPARKWIPLFILAISTALGAGLSYAGGVDVVNGVFEGFFGGATAIGVYKAGAPIPGVNKVLSSQAWYFRD